MGSEMCIRDRRKIMAHEGPALADGTTLVFGFLWPGNGYHECIDEHVLLRDWILAYYWSQCKEPMTGFSILKGVTRFKIPRACRVTLWHVKSNQAGMHVHLQNASGTVKLDFSRYMETLDADTYLTKDHVHGIVFACAAPDEIADVATVLEIEGFPVPQSLRLQGLGHALTEYGLSLIHI